MEGRKPLPCVCYGYRKVIRHFERGQQSGKTIVGMAASLGVSPADLFDGDEPPEHLGANHG